MLLHPHRITPFENFRIRHTRIGHVRLHRITAVESRPGTGPPRNRFVILVDIVTESDIVHRSGTRRHDAERAVERIGDALRCFDIAGDGRGRRVRVQHRAFRDDDRERFEAAGVEWNIAFHQGAENIQHSRRDDGRRRVEIGFKLL